MGANVAERLWELESRTIALAHGFVNVELATRAHLSRVCRQARGAARLPACSGGGGAAEVLEDPGRLAAHHPFQEPRCAVTVRVAQGRPFIQNHGRKGRPDPFQRRMIDAS